MAFVTVITEADVTEADCYSESISVLEKIISALPQSVMFCQQTSSYLERCRRRLNDPLSC